QKEIPQKKIEKAPAEGPKAPEAPETAVKAVQRIPKILPITDEQKEKAALQKDEELVMIENILSEDIKDLYSQLPQLKQKAFQQKGEEAALKIKVILKKTRVRANEIFELIKNWLKMLPKITIYFLEQEAKIKTDKVLEMRKRGQEIER
ncbi:hypothetical protein KJ885_05850, partial [Patescibacteria group bacterium]|nr:hypothetical protein [Patescibacteria group bacterium]